MSNAIAQAASPSSPTLRYDEMCRAIARAYAVDEAKTLMDQATAIEVYAHQSQNIEAERQACEIRMRATRRLGQLLAAREKAKGAAQPGVGRKGRAGMMSQQTTPLVDLGITRDQSSRYRRLAAVPEPAFEAALAAPGRVTTGGIIAAQSEPTVNAVDDRALWLWGRLKDLARRTVRC